MRDRGGVLPRSSCTVSGVLVFALFWCLGRGVQAFVVLPAARQATAIKRTIVSSESSAAGGTTLQLAAPDETYQTNLDIAKLASASQQSNATAAVAAHRLLQTLSHPDTVTYNGVLKAYAKSPSMDGAQRAQDLLEEMERIYKEQSDANRAWYDSIREGHVSENDISAGAPRIDVKPNVRSYSTVMDAWSRRKTPGAAQRAQAILERLDELHATTGDISFQPNTISYNTVIAAWAKSDTGAEGAAQAQRLLEQMGPLADTISYNTALLAIARSGLPDAGERAEGLLRTMQHVRPNARTYTTVIDAWSRSHETLGSAGRALSLLKEMEKLYAETGDQAFRPNCISYSTTINAYALSKEPNKAAMAWKILQRMEDLAESGENVQAKPSLITYNSVLNACATSTSWDHMQLKQMVHSLYQDIIDSPSLQPDHFTYGTVLKACANVFCGEHDSPEFVRDVFQKCCEDGQVSFGVCYQLRQAATSELYRSLIPARAYNPTNGHFSIQDMPKEWTRNVRERRAREAIDRS